MLCGFLHTNQHGVYKGMFHRTNNQKIHPNHRNVPKIDHHAMLLR